MIQDWGERDRGRAIPFDFHDEPSRPRMSVVDWILAALSALLFFVQASAIFLVSSVG